MKVMKFQQSRIWAICTFHWGRKLIFPKSITITESGIETHERLAVVTFWRTRKEKMPHSKIASVATNSGLIWDSVAIETTGGSDAIILKGYSKIHARQLSDGLQELVGR